MSDQVSPSFSVRASFPQTEVSYERETVTQQHDPETRTIISTMPETLNESNMQSGAQKDLPVVTLYWLEQSRSQRILWLLEALGAPYKLEIFHRNPRTKLAPLELKRIHSLGKSPVISIQPEGADEPVVIAESGVIVEYLCEHYGKGSSLVPNRWLEGKEGKIGGETEEYLRWKYYMHYGEGSLMQYLMAAIIAGRIKSAPVPFFIKPITGRIAGNITEGYLKQNFTCHFEFLESQLRTSPNGGKFLCGRALTAADILTSFPLIAAKLRSASLTEDLYPLLWNYIEDLEHNEDYLRACKKIQEIEGKFEALI